MKSLMKKYRCERKQTKGKSYKLRYGSIVAMMLIGILVIGTVLLLCTFKRDEVPAMRELSSNIDGDNLVRDPVIVLDAGHGGKDPGAMWEEVCEKDINLQIAQKTKKILEDAGYQVVMTRYDDRKVSLAERADMAARASADVFVSIHQNSIEDDETSKGIETYCNENVNRNSFALASSVHDNTIERTKARDRGVESGSDLYVVNKTKMASCLIETGFLTSAEERELLLDQKYQNKLSKGIADGIIQYLGRNDIISSEDTSRSAHPVPTTIVNSEPEPDEKVIYLTIDDGPTSRTPEILEILDKYNVKATFFVTAQFLQGNNLKRMLRLIHEKGHTIGVHTYSHDYKDIYKSVEHYMADYKKMNDIIIDATGESSCIFRFPGGSNTGYNRDIRKKLFAEVKRQGLVYYDWNAFTGDADGLSKSKMIAKTIEESTYNRKTILLMHDVPGKQELVEILPKILSKLKKKGYTFRNLDKTVVPIQFAK